MLLHFPFDRGRESSSKLLHLLPSFIKSAISISFEETLRIIISNNVSDLLFAYFTFYFAHSTVAIGMSNFFFFAQSSSGEWGVLTFTQ